MFFYVDVVIGVVDEVLVVAVGVDYLPRGAVDLLAWGVYGAGVHVGGLGGV